MKQLTIYCSTELNESVVQIFRDHEIENYVHVPELYGNALKKRGSYERDQVWKANSFVLFLEESVVDKIISDLKGYIDKCEIQPCLRLVVTPIEQIY